MLQIAYFYSHNNQFWLSSYDNLNSDWCYWRFSSINSNSNSDITQLVLAKLKAHAYFKCRQIFDLFPL